MNEERFLEIYDKYVRKGIRKGSELLLPISVAQDVLKELPDAEIAIAGLTVWKYVRLQSGELGIAEEWQLSKFFEDEIYKELDACEQTAKASLEYIDSLPEYIDFITIYLDSKKYFNWFT